MDTNERAKVKHILWFEPSKFKKTHDMPQHAKTQDRQPKLFNNFDCRKFRQPKLLNNFGCRFWSDFDSQSYLITLPVDIFDSQSY